MNQTTPDLTAGPLGTTTTPLLENRPTHGRIHRFAGMMHRTIDSIEQSLDSKSRGAASAQSKYGDQAREYGGKLRGQINAHPLQSAGVALGAGVLLDRMFSRSPRVRVVNVPARQPQVRIVREPVHTPSSWNASRPPEWRARRSTDVVGSRLHELGDAGHQAMGKIGAAAGLGLAGTRAMASSLTDKAGTLPLQMRLATQRLLARSQAYGTLARSEMQSHPLIGVGAGLGVGALITTLLMQRRGQDDDSAYVAVDDRGSGVAWQRDRYGAPSGAGGMMASRPVASAAVMLGVGALLGAMLRRT